ncbi:death domain-associated protein 6-like [Haliotis rubra]|uniref:death domain-associated protein 6-like n=1 Tax=Haliotis rubra TaxID=36100 RepID=UPI001EE4F513|nr:death domain-associated protein 6-like [Haliotis rubra]
MMDFNPLDLLAAAAALQRDDPKSSNQSGGQTQSEANCDDKNTEESTEEEDSSNSNKMGSARKLRSEIKRQNSCNLPSSEVGKLFSEKSSGVDYVVDEDSPGRTIRRHSWSAEGEVVGDSAKITDLSVEHEESKTDSSQKAVEESDEAPCENDSLDIGQSGCGDSPEVSEDASQPPPPDPAGAQSADEDDSSESASVKETSEGSPVESGACDVSVTEPAQVEQDDESVIEQDNVSDFDLTEPTAACCPVCHKPRTDYAVGVSDPSELCAICEKQTVSENGEAASPSGFVEEPVPGSAAGPSIGVIDNEQSESGFVAIVSDRTCLDTTDNEEKSSLLETYLTTGHTEKVQENSFSMEMHASKSSEESMMDTTDCDVRMESNDASGPASSVESDHSYASQPGKVTERQSTDYYDTETGAESDSCGENSSTEEVEHRARSMSIESVCLRFGFEDKHMTLPVKEHEDSDHMSGQGSLLWKSAIQPPKSWFTSFTWRISTN